MTTISVIIPAYNAEASIAEAVESALLQTYAPLEVIVVDDGSTDGTARLVENRFGSSVVLHRQRNGGASTARNAGMRLAKGDILAFLDADDLWLPMKLDAQMSALAQFPTADVCYTDVRLPGGNVRGLSYPVFRDHSWGYRDVFSRSGQITVGDLVVDVYAGNIIRALLYNGMILPSSALVRAEFARRLQLKWDKGAAGEDALFFMEASRYTEYAYVDAPLVEYRIPERADGRLSANANNPKRIATFIEGVQRIAAESGVGAEAAGWVRHCLAHSYRRLGYHRLSDLDLALARAPLTVSLRHDPWNIRTYVLLFSSFLPRWGVQALGSVKRKVGRISFRKASGQEAGS